MKNKNEEKIRNFLVIMYESEDIFDVVYKLDEFLNSNDRIKKRVRFNHDSTFITLIKRFINTYKYWYVRKQFKSKDGVLYFKFSNATMFHEKFIKNDSIRAITVKQLAFLINHGVIKKAYFEIEEGKTATHYSVDFDHILKYFNNFYTALAEDADADIKKLKLKLKK